MDWFGDDVADSYGEDSTAMFEPAAPKPQLDLLETLADGGRVLELAIGTGRVAIPLSARGVRVSGIELSEAMLIRMRAKPGGDAASIPVVLGDMASAWTLGAGTFRLAYLVFDTITNLTSQDAPSNPSWNPRGDLIDAHTRSGKRTPAWTDHQGGPSAKVTREERAPLAAARA